MGNHWRMVLELGMLAWVLYEVLSIPLSLLL